MKIETVIAQIKAYKYFIAAPIIPAALLFQSNLSRRTSFICIALAVVAALLSVLYSMLRHRHPSFSLRWVLKQSGAVRETGTAFYAAALVAMTVGVLNYYRFDARNLVQERNYDDITYYYLNSKYFDELGYKNLYAAMLVADNEGPRRLSDVRQFRDLSNYDIKPVAEAYKQAAAIKARFSTERWAQFSHDINYISGTWKGGDWHYLFSDHGYNPPPTWTLVGGFLSGICPVEIIKLIASVDIVLVVAMFGTLLWAFGLDVLIFSLLFYVTTLSGHWPMAGQALLRFDWLAASVIGWSLFKKKKHAASGAAFAYAGLVRLFPMVLFLPFGVAVLRDLVTKRTLQRKYLLFIVGAAAMTVLLVGGAAARYDTEAFAESKAKMAMHAGPDSYSSQRVGLGDAMIFHGEVNRLEMNLRGGTLGKGEEIRGRMPYLYLIALSAIAFLVVFQLRSKEPEYLFAPLAVVLIFILTTPQINYYNIRIFLFAWSVARFKSVRSTIGLVLLFCTEACARYCDITYLRYNSTSWSSVWLTVYFAFVAISHGKEVLGGRFGADARDGAADWMRRISPQAAMAGILALLAIPHLVYRSRESAAFEPQEVQLSKLAREVKDGVRWDARGNIVMEKQKGVTITLPDRTRNRRGTVSLDGNDTYLLAFYHGSTAVGSISLGPRSGPGSGMAVYSFKVPSKIAEKGIDKIRVIPKAGDGAFSIGHLRLTDK